MKCKKPNLRITFSDEVLPPEEERRLIARALVILFQLDTKSNLKIEDLK